MLTELKENKCERGWVVEFSCSVDEQNTMHRKFGSW